MLLSRLSRWTAGIFFDPAETADTVQTFTVPFTGIVELETEVSRYLYFRPPDTYTYHGSLQSTYLRELRSV